MAQSEVGFTDRTLRRTLALRVATALATSAMFCLCRTGSAQDASKAEAAEREATRLDKANTQTFDRVDPEVIWLNVERAYQKARVVPTFYDRSIFTQAYIVSPAPKSVAGIKLQDAFDCGGDKKAPLAASTPLEVTLRSVVTPVGARGSKLVTSATAIPLEPMASGQLAACRSTGKIEKRLQVPANNMVVFVIDRSLPGSQP